MIEYYFNKIYLDSHFFLIIKFNLIFFIEMARSYASMTSTCNTVDLFTTLPDDIIFYIVFRCQPTGCDIALYTNIRRVNKCLNLFIISHVHTTIQRLPNSSIFYGCYIDSNRMSSYRFPSASHLFMDEDDYIVDSHYINDDGILPDD